MDKLNCKMQAHVKKIIKTRRKTTGYPLKILKEGPSEATDSRTLEKWILM